MRMLRAILLARAVAFAIAVLLSGSIFLPADANDLHQRRGGWHTGWGFGPFEMKLVQLVAPIWGHPPDVLRGPHIKKNTPDDALDAALRGGTS